MSYIIYKDCVFLSRRGPRWDRVIRHKTGGLMKASECFQNRLIKFLIIKQ